MKKIIITLALSLALTACTGNTPQSPDKNNQVSPTPVASDADKNAELKVSDYFPLNKDVHLKYKGTGNEYAEYETYVDFIRGNKIQLRYINPGTVSVRTFQIEDGMLKRLFSEGEIYYKYDYTSAKDEEEILIKEPIQEGAKWVLKDGGERSITAVDKQISLPIGNYTALEITTKKDDTTMHDYYVKDIGLVKSVFTAKSKDVLHTISSELEKIEKNVPYKQTIRLYYPDYANDRIVYIDRDTDINTNEDIKYKFQKELKTIPENSNISKVLTTNVEINKVELDEASDIVTVDFSPHLTNEMNAGSGFESMLLECIVNTFGEYFQKDKVIITVDGKPYSSGHILMKTGEYFKVDTSKAMKY